MPKALIVKEQARELREYLLLLTNNNQPLSKSERETIRFHIKTLKLAIEEAKKGN